MAVSGVILIHFLPQNLSGRPDKPTVFAFCLPVGNHTLAPLATKVTLSHTYPMDPSTPRAKTSQV